MPYIRLCVLSSILVLLASLAGAQDATLTGDVVDSSGGAVPGATVVLRDAGATAPVETVSDGQGTFRFPPARSGVYDLSVTLPGFSPFTLRGLRLEVGERQTVHVKLEPSRLEETITVVAKTTSLANTRADRSVVIENEFVISIPLNIRNPLQMINNAVGVTPTHPDSGNNTLSQSQHVPDQRDEGVDH